MAESTDSQIDLSWNIVVEVARVLADECTITEAGLMAATDAARAAVCVIKREDGSSLTWIEDKLRRRRKGTGVTKDKEVKRVRDTLMNVIGQTRMRLKESR